MRSPSVLLGGPAGERDRGSGTVLTLSLVAVVLLVGALLGVVAGVLVAHARAQGAADLGALAAASRLQRHTLFGGSDGPAAVTAGASAGRAAVTSSASASDADGTPCALADAVVARNDARTTRCTTGSDGVVTVEVTVDSPTGAALARARAGPRSTGSTP